MSIERLRLFAEVVKQGSYTRAAEHLGVSKGYLSTQIKQLEQQLDKQLLVRNTRTMRLTSAGELVFREADKLTSFWIETKALLDEREDTPSGQVKCTAPVGVANHLLWPVLRELMADYPEIRLLVESGNQTQNLITSDFDFAVRITNTPPQDMVAVRLARFHYVCCATPEFLDRYGRPTVPEELARLPCLALAHWHFWTFTREGKSQRVDLEARLLASDNDLLKKALLAHQGVARLPEYMIRNELRSGALIPVLADYTAEQRDIYLLYPQMSSRPYRVTLCLEKLKKAFVLPEPPADD